MRKLRLTSISGNSEHCSTGGDDTASKILHLMGFRAKNYSTNITEDELDLGMYIGAFPKTGTEFFIYYDGPLGDVKEGGNFSLVRVDGGVEFELDGGTMQLGHYNQGIMPTYYAKGTMLPSYSFHITFTPEEARQNAIPPVAKATVSK